MSAWVFRLDRILSAVVVWTIILCLVGGLALAAVIVIVPLHYLDRWRPRGSHQRGTT